jgi:hypothetical protein
MIDKSAKNGYFFSNTQTENERNMSKRKRREAVGEPKRSSNRGPLILLGVIAVIIVLISSRRERVAETTASITPTPTAQITSTIPRQVYPPTPDAELPTAEQTAFVNTQLMPAWDHIRAYYPLTNLRADFDRFMQRTQNGDVQIIIKSKRFTDGSPPALATKVNGRLTVVLCIPVLMDIWNEIGERETIADIVVGIMLHEQYHLDHHANMPPEQLSYRQRIQNEAEAWWYSIEMCYQPMLDAGRLTHLRRDDADQAIWNGLLAYRTAQGNRNHPAWWQFAESASPPPPPEQRR